MGRLIDADKLQENQYRIDDSATLSTRDVVDVEDIEDAPTVEAIPKADYETRLKADMVAMLEDLRLDFQEAELAGVLDNKELIFADEADDLILQKISALRGNTE